MRSPPGAAGLDAHARDLEDTRRLTGSLDARRNSLRAYGGPGARRGGGGEHRALKTAANTVSALVAAIADLNVARLASACAASIHSSGAGAEVDFRSMLASALCASDDSDDSADDAPWREHSREDSSSRHG